MSDMPVPADTLPVNPSHDQLAQLPVGSQVVIEGTFVGTQLGAGWKLTGEAERKYRERWSAHNLEGDIWELAHQLRISIGGRQVVVTTQRAQQDPEVTYEAGVLENLQGEKLRIGETIRIVTTVAEGHWLDAGWNNAFLVEPSPDRAREYDQYRVANQEKLAKLRGYIQTRQYDEARQMFAFVRSCKATQAEKDAAVALMLTVPVVYRSVYEPHEDARLSVSITARLETYTKWEWLVYVSEYLHGRHSYTTGEYADIPKLLECTKQAPFDSSNHYHMVITALWAGLTESGRYDEGHVGRQAYQALLAKAISELRHILSPWHADDLVQLVDYCTRMKRPEQHALGELLDLSRS